MITIMKRRRLKPELEQLLATYPAVAVLGPRQAGKTTLALDLAGHHSAIYLYLESTADQAKLQNAELYLSDHQDGLVILDEVQRTPGLFQNLRGLIDQGRRQGRRYGRFLLLGSASVDFLQQSSAKLAGRIAYLELTPFDALELAADSTDLLWLRGGFPDSVLAAQDAISM